MYFDLCRFYHNYEKELAIPICSNTSTDRSIGYLNKSNQGQTKSKF